MTGPVAAPNIPPRPTVDDIISWNQLDEVNATDTGNAKRFVRLFRDLVRFVPETGTWLVWSGTHWEPDVAGRTFALTAGVVRAIREEALTLPDEPGEGGGPSPRARLLAHALKTESETARRRMISVAPENPEVVVRAENLDVEAHLLTAPNGAIDLDTGDLVSNRPEHHATACVRVPYDPAARSGELDRYLDTFVPDPEDQAVLWAVLGSCLHAGNSGRMLPILLGHTTSGKTQLVAAVARLLRGYATPINASVFRGNLDDRPRPDLVRAMFTRLAYATEASSAWELHADQVKRLTGGDEISFRDLYGRPTAATPRFTPLIVTNDMPRVRAADLAFRRRMIVIRFDRTIDAKLEDPGIKERFTRDDGVLGALLARLVEGARSPLLRHGVKWDLIPQRFAVETMEAFDELDHIGEFLRWLVDHGHVEVVNAADVPASHCVKAGELHSWYTHWVKKYGNKLDQQERLSMRDLGAQLRQRGWESRMASGTRWLGWKLVSDVPWL